MCRTCEYEFTLSVHEFWTLRLTCPLCENEDIVRQVGKVHIPRLVLANREGK
jgi:hypothetical protein